MTAQSQPMTPPHWLTSRVNDVDRTHPTTPESPTLYIRANRHGRALRRQPSVIFARIIQHYNPEPSTTVHASPTTPQSQPNTTQGRDPSVTGSVADLVKGAEVIAVGMRSESFNNVDTTAIPTADPHLRPESDFELLLHLDSYTRPGISEAQFQRLFVKCHGCSLFMTNRTFGYHDCKETLVGGNEAALGSRVIDLSGDLDLDMAGGREVIDLTTGDDD